MEPDPTGIIEKCHYHFYKKTPTNQNVRRGFLLPNSLSLNRLVPFWSTYQERHINIYQ